MSDKKKQIKKLRKEVQDLGDIIDRQGRALEDCLAMLGDLHATWFQGYEKPKNSVPAALPPWATKIEPGVAVITDSEGGKHYGQEQPDGSVNFGPFAAVDPAKVDLKVQGTTVRRSGDTRRFSKKLDDPCADCGAVGGVECPVSCPRMIDEALAEEDDDNEGLTAADGGVIGWDPELGRPVQVREVTPNADKERPPYTFWFTEEMCERLGIQNIQRHLREKEGGALEIVDGPPVDLLPEHAELIRETIGAQW